MSKYNDNMFRLLQQFIDKYGDDFETVEEAIQTFMESYNEDIQVDELEKSPRQESMDLFYQAMDEKDCKKQKALVQEAIEIWPENWDAQTFLVEGDIAEQIKELTDLEARAKEQWQALGLGSWRDIDARPYFRVKYHLITLLSQQGLLLQARQLMEEILEEDEFDALGVRYNLMAILCRLYDWKAAIEFFNALPYDGREDDRMVLMLLILAILTGRESYALDLLADLKLINDGMSYLIKFKTWPLDQILAYSDVDRVKPGTFDTLAITLLDIMSLIIGSNYSLLWIRKNYKKADPFRRINLNDKVISFQGASQQRNLMLKNDPLFKDIVHNAFHALIEQGYREVSDFNEVTEKELLKIKHIGPKTIEQLKINGAKFKEET